MKLLVAIFAFAMLSGCASVRVDMAGAKSLGAAGQSATSALQTHAEDVKKSVEGTPTVVSVYGVLNCRDQKDAALRRTCIDSASKIAGPMLVAELDKIKDVLEKRRVALGALNSAYAAFASLVDYDARGTAVKAVEGAFSSINTLSATLGLGQIASGIGKIVGAAAGAYADNEKAEAVLATSKDLREALEAMVKALKAEENLAAMKSLAMEMEAERRRLELSALRAGVLNAEGILKPYFAKTAPEVALASPIPSYATDLANAAAATIVENNTEGKSKQLAASYMKAVNALNAVAVEHTKLEHKQQVDLALVIAELKYLRDLYESAK